MSFAVAQSGKSLFEECLGTKGFIGSNSLGNSVLKIDYDGRKIIISDDIKNFDTNNYDELKLVLADYSLLQPFVLLVVGNTGFYAELDSGYTGGISIVETDLLRLQNAGQISEKINGEGYGGIALWGKGNVKAISKAKLKSEIQIGSLKFDPDFVDLDYSTNLIGNEVLEKLNPIIDYKNKKVYFKKIDSFNLEQQNKPIGGLVIDGKYSIAKIWNPYMGKTNIGDEILEIDGKKPEFKDNCFLLNEQNPLKNAKTLFSEKF